VVFSPDERCEPSCGATALELRLTASLVAADESASDAVIVDSTGRKGFSRITNARVDSCGEAY
jgi:hypothetical protein